MTEHTIAAIIQANLIYVIIAMGLIFVGVLIYRKTRSEPKQEDFSGTFQRMAVDDMNMNVPDKDYPYFIQHGSRIIGKILRHSENDYSYDPEYQEWKLGRGGKWQMSIESITFLPKKTIGIWHGEVQILRFKAGRGKISPDRKNLMFPSQLTFDRLGREWLTKEDFKYISGVIESDWSKRLLTSNVSLFASKMASISGEKPEFAHEREMERLRIEAIRQQKQARITALG